MKTAITNITILLFASVITYIMISFCILELDFRKWDQQQRIMEVFCSFVLYLVFAFLKYAVEVE